MEDKVVIASQTFTSANILKASIKCNGLKGGDSGHGCYVELSLEDLGGTYISCEETKNEDGLKKITIKTGGDSERQTLLLALKLFVSALEI